MSARILKLQGKRLALSARAAMSDMDKASRYVTIFAMKGVPI